MLYRIHHKDSQTVVETVSVHSHAQIIATRHQPPQRHLGSRRHRVEVQSDGGAWADAGVIEHKPDGTAQYVPLPLEPGPS